MSLFGLLVIIFIDWLLMFMPIYRSLECHYWQIIRDPDDILRLYQIDVNQLMFFIVNWIELAYLYGLWRGLRRIKND